MGTAADSLLIETDNSEIVSAVSHALTNAGIPYETALRPSSPPSVAIFVPWVRMADARRAALRFVDADVDQDAVIEEEWEELQRGELPPLVHAGFPWGPFQAVISMVLFHTGLLFWTAGSLPSGRQALEWGALIPGTTLEQPWRLLTSIFLHLDLRHVLYNGLAMLVFAVPILSYLGLSRTSALYFGSGIGGALATSWLATSGTLTVGSSGAVAGLFGAWVALMLQRARVERFGWRGYVRTLGIALLFLPSLLSPEDSAGRPVSVTSHLGGMFTGMLIGAAMYRGLVVARSGTRRGAADAERAGMRPDPWVN